MTRKLTPYLLIIPACVLFLVFCVAPIGIVAVQSLWRTNYIVSEFVGLRNYLRIFTDDDTLRVISNSFAYSALIVPGYMAIALTVVMLTFNAKPWLQAYSRFAFYLPTVIAGVILSMVWRWGFHPVGGLANWLLGLVGLGPYMWMAGRWSAIVGISIVIVMASGGGTIVILQAATLSINHEIIDAARIDGASWLQVKARIVLPIITPMILLLLLVSLIGTLQIYETIYVMYPVADAHNLMFDVYWTAFTRSRYGLASAKTMVLMGVILVAAVTQRLIQKRWAV